MIKKLLIYTTLFLQILNVSAQKQMISFSEMEELFNDIKQFYQNDKYWISMYYASFKGHDGKFPEDEFKGFVKKKGDIIESYSPSGFTVQNNDVKILVDSSEMFIGLTYVDTIESMQFNIEVFEMGTYNIQESQLRWSGRTRILDLKFRPGYTYEKIEMSILPSGMISKMVMLFSSEIQETESGEKAKPKIVVDYMLMNDPVVIHALNEFISVSGKNYSLSPSFKKQNFELIDFRYKN